MPAMAGREAFDELRRVDEQVPMVVCSGRREREAEKEFARRDVAGFLAKPFRSADLAVLLQRILEGGSSRIP